MAFFSIFMHLLLIFFLSTSNANFTFNPFNESSFKNGCSFTGDVSSNKDSVDLTRNKYNKVINDSIGKVYYEEPFRFKNATTAASFSTFVTFQITTSPDICPGDGIWFFLQAHPGDDPGLFAISSGPSATNPFLAVEFDTYVNNDSATDSDYNIPCGSANKCSSYSSHVAIDLNTFISVNYSCYAGLTSGKQQAWIDYDAHTKTLEVRMANESGPRPSRATVSAQHVDLHHLFSRYDSLYVGLYGLTVVAAELHTVYSWSFNISQLDDHFNITQLEDHLPAPSPSPFPAPPRKHLSVPVIVVMVVIIFVFLCALLSFFYIKLARKTEQETSEMDGSLQGPSHRRRKDAFGVDEFEPRFGSK